MWLVVGLCFYHPAVALSLHALCLNSRIIFFGSGAFILQKGNTTDAFTFFHGDGVSMQRNGKNSSHSLAQCKPRDQSRWLRYVGRSYDMEMSYENSVAPTNPGLLPRATDMIASISA